MRLSRSNLEPRCGAPIRSHEIIDTFLMRPFACCTQVKDPVEALLDTLSTGTVLCRLAEKVRVVLFTITPCVGPWLRNTL